MYCNNFGVILANASRSQLTLTSCLDFLQFLLMSLGRHMCHIYMLEWWWLAYLTWSQFLIYSRFLHVYKCPKTFNHLFGWNLNDSKYFSSLSSCLDPHLVHGQHIRYFTLTCQPQLRCQKNAGETSAFELHVFSFWKAWVGKSSIILFFFHHISFQGSWRSRSILSS